MSNIGSRCKVMHGNANKTSGGLTKEDLMYNKQGKIVSIKMSKNAKKEQRLKKAGWTVKKGEFGAILMKGGVGINNNNNNNNNNNQFNNSGSPIKKPKKNVNNAYKNIIYIPGSRENILRKEKNKAINIAINMGYNLKNTNLIKHRNYANPANAVFIDKISRKVYKIGLWSSNNVRSIENECKAYDKLMEKYPEHMNIHYPQKHSCNNIPGTDFGILTLEFIPNIKMMTSINNDMEININFYLSGAGIKHNDLLENVFKHENYSNETPNFLIMDFEDVTFMNKTPKNSNNSNNNNNNSKRGPGLFGKNNNRNN
jgi:hypothetical protein